MIVRQTALIVLAAGALMLGNASDPLLAAPSKQVAKIQPNTAKFNSYILGPGDTLEIEIFDIPDLSGIFTIGPDGTIYLPRLRALFVEGLTVDELRYFLVDQFKTYVKNPEIYIKPAGYRPVRVYVGGEVGRPGYYLLSGGQTNTSEFTKEATPYNNTSRRDTPFSIRLLAQDDVSAIQGVRSVSSRWPTLFDSLRAAQGVTPFSDLTNVQVIRKRPLGEGGGKVRANVDFLRLVSSGDESVNIRLFDGDVVKVARSSQVMRDQLIDASRSNLSPDFVEVFVSGRVKEPGPQILPQGATLNQAIASAGGPKLLRGSVEFLRFNQDGSTDRRRFSYKSSVEADDYRNPVLITGDVVRINDSLFSAGVEVLNEITGPAVGIYSVYSLFKP